MDAMAMTMQLVAVQNTAAQGSNGVVGNFLNSSTPFTGSENTGNAVFATLIQTLLGNNIKAEGAQLITKKGEENAQILAAQMLAQNPMLAALLAQNGFNSDDAAQLLTQAIQSGIPISELADAAQSLPVSQNAQKSVQDVQQQVQAAQESTGKPNQGAQEVNAALQAAHSAKGTAQTSQANAQVEAVGSQKEQPVQAVKLYEQSNVESAAFRTRILDVNSEAQPEGEKQSSNEGYNEAGLSDKAGKTEKAERPVNDKLPEGEVQAAQGSFEKTLESVKEAAKSPQQLTSREGADVVRQTVSGLKENVNAGKEEFVMRLKPEGLGEITVKLESINGKTTLQLTAQNQNVQRLLTGELEALKQAVKPYNVEVREITVSATQHSENFTADTGTGGQQQQQQQLYDMMNGRFSFGEGSHKGYQAFERILSGDVQEEEGEGLPQAKISTSSAIDTYI